MCGHAARFTSCRAGGPPTLACLVFWTKLPALHSRTALSASVVLAHSETSCARVWNHLPLGFEYGRQETGRLRRERKCSGVLENVPQLQEPLDSLP